MTRYQCIEMNQGGHGTGAAVTMRARPGGAMGDCHQRRAIAISMICHPESTVQAVAL
jgi:hypothetical protein